LTTAIFVLINLYLTGAVTKFQPNGMKKICLELDNLASKVVETKEIIDIRWRVKDQKHRLSNIQLTTFVSSKNMKKTTTQSKLEVNRKIVQAFISPLRKLRKQFSAFSAANDIAHRLKRIEWIASNVIYYIQEIQLAPKSRNTDTEVIRPTKSAAINKTSSWSSVMVAAQSSAAAEQARLPVTSLQLEGIALQAFALLEDLYSQILIMQGDFIKLDGRCASRM
ncbi:unnamed protein product, partial [Porites lobata]